MVRWWPLAERILVVSPRMMSNPAQTKCFAEQLIDERKADRSRKRVFIHAHPQPLTCEAEEALRHVLRS